MKTEKTSNLRKLSIYGFKLIERSHNIYALLEFDITNIRSTLRMQRQHGQSGSLFAFLLKAIGMCLEKYPDFNSIINLHKTTIFKEVDINIPIEVKNGDMLVTKQYIIRNINNKSLFEISNEIEEAKRNSNDEKGFVFSKILLKIITSLPTFLILFFFKSIVSNHKKTKQLSGTIFVTSVSMFSNSPGYIIPYIGGPKACSIAIGSSNKKVMVINGNIEIREMINITLVFNHDIIDGAPAARFINELRDLIEKKYKKIIFEK